MWKNGRENVQLPNQDCEKHEKRAEMGGKGKDKELRFDDKQEPDAPSGRTPAQKQL